MSINVRTRWNAGQIFTRIELCHLFVACILTSLTMSYPEFGNMPVFALTVVSAFTVHELAHKFTALLYGVRARFQLWIPGLIVTMLSAILPIKLVMPGAVYLLDHPKNVEETAYIALAGPLGNVALALLASQVWHPLAFQIVGLNLLIAVLNMIPFAPLDGWRISVCDGRIWLLLFGVLLVAYVVYLLGGI